MAKTKLTLELSGVEASVLLALLDSATGDPKGLRGVADSIGAALSELHIEAALGTKGDVVFPNAT